MLPVAQYLFGVCYLDVTEHVRMPRHHLRGRRLRYGGRVETVLLARDLRMHRNLQKQIAKLVTQPLVVA